MTEEQRPLSLEEIKKLKDIPQKKVGRKAKVDVQIRDFPTWFKLTLRERKCHFCDTRRMCAEINGFETCRFCFLKGLPAE